MINGVGNNGVNAARLYGQQDPAAVRDAQQAQAAAKPAVNQQTKGVVATTTSGLSPENAALAVAAENARAAASVSRLASSASVLTAVAGRKPIDLKL
jgi:hypothetical protein